MRYRGQGHEIEVALPVRDLDADDRARIDEAFAQAYRHLYGRTIPGLESEIMTWLLSVRTPTTAPAPVAWPDRAGAGTPPARERSFVDGRTGRRERLGVVERAALAAEHRIAGPAAIVEDDTTTLVPAGWRAARNTRGDLVLWKDAP
jgi:N-methylhydantoinase A